jgi:amino acid permease
MAFCGVAGIVIFIICLVANFFYQMIELNWTVHMEPFPRDWWKVAAVIPNIMLALAYHMNFFPIYKGILIDNLGLKNSNDSKMGKASLVGLAVVGFFYILVGNIGYALYG